MEFTGSRLGFWVSICLMGSATFSSAVSGTLTEKVIEDIPGRLVLELNVSGQTVLPVGAYPGMRVSCPGCHTPSRTNAPDLPVYRFDILGGATPPTVSFQILESETRLVPEGIAPVPVLPTPSTVEYRPDPEMFNSAAALAARHFGVRTFRGAPVRGVEVPLATWSVNGKSLTLIKRMRVQLDFGGVLAQPSALRLEGRFRHVVKNPVGGAYLYTAPASPFGRRSRALGKIAAARDSLGSRLVRIKVGDISVESFDEDRLYGLSFPDLMKISGMSAELSALKPRDLRIFTGINDTLRRFMDTGTVPTSGTLREIPIKVEDRNGNGSFDENDSIYFFGHGTSIWKRLPEATARIRFEFSTDPYSFENYYYLDFSSREGKSEGLRLAESAPSAPTGSPLSASYFYLRAEKEQETAGCDPSGLKDEETGFDWFWFWKGDCGYGRPVQTLTSSSLTMDETATLPNLEQNGVNDSLFMGFYVYRSRADSIFKAYYGGEGDTMEHYRSTGSPGSWYVWTKAVKTPAVLQLDRLDWSGA